MTSIPNFKLYITDVENASSFHDKAITHMVSIGDIDDKPPYIKHWAKRPAFYRFEFDDISNEKADPAKYQLVSEKDIIRILYIADTIKSSVEAGTQVNLLIHCAAGISRSTATAFVILNAILGPGNEQKCIQMVYDARPIACPNYLVTKLADQALGRNGKMSEVVARFNMTRYGVGAGPAWN
jgi:predicted protein tyrosine phosphatase